MKATSRKSLYSLLALIGAVCLMATAGCSKDEKKDSKAPAANAKAPAANAKAPMKHDMGKMNHAAKTPDKGATAMDPAKMANARKVAVKVDAEGYDPSAIPAKAGEHLKLVFTRVSDKGCGDELVLASTGKKYQLPLNKAVEVPVVAGASGDVTFACGMNMMKGKVVVQ